MSEQNHILLLRALSNELSESEEQEFQKKLEGDGDLRAEYERLTLLSGMITASAHNAFGPSFADRVVEKLGSSSGTERFTIGDVLGSLFARLAPIALGITIALGAYNITTSHADQSTLEAALGLQPVTVEAGYDAALNDIMSYEQ